MVAAELGIDTLERRVSVGLGLLDTVAVSLLALVVLRRVLGLCKLQNVSDPGFSCTSLSDHSDHSARCALGFTYWPL